MRLTNPETKLKLSDTKRYDLQDHKMFEKLKELEDMEEEYGIDLNILLKLLLAVDKGFVYVKVRKIKQYTGYSAIEETGEIKRTVITRFSRYINGTRDWFFTIYSGDTSIVTNYLLKDYGVKWAFTREELEIKKEKTNESNIVKC